MKESITSTKNGTSTKSIYYFNEIYVIYFNEKNISLQRNIIYHFNKKIYHFNEIYIITSTKKISLQPKKNYVNEKNLSSQRNKSYYTSKKKNRFNEKKITSTNKSMQHHH